MTNKVFIRTDKASYVSGETVTGLICLNVVTPLPAQAIFLKVKGFEKTKWRSLHSELIPNSDPPQYREVHQEHEGKNEFFRDKVVVFKAATVELPVGQWSYPFSWALPANLPGVFAFHGDFGRSGIDLHAHIVYKVKAVVDVPSGFSSDLKSTQTITIYEALKSDVKPVSAEKTGKVLLCCCIPRGEVELKASFDANSYMPGSVAKVVASVENRSKSDVNHMVVKLMRELRFRANDGASVVSVNEMARNTYDGCKSFDKKTRDVPLNLPAETQPGTSGRLVSCRYWADVECDIPMAPDIEIHMPLTIFARPPSTWGTPGMEAFHFQPFA